MFNLRRSFRAARSFSLRSNRSQARAAWPTLEALEDRCLLALLGLAQLGQKPDITSGIINDLSYTQTGNNANAFHYDSIPLYLTLPDGSVDYISDPSDGSWATTSLDAILDNSGNLAPGHAGNNPFSVTGSLTIGAQSYDGTLLTAQAQAFGFADSFSSATGEFEVRLVVTGGQLAGPVNAQPRPFRVGDEFALLLHQPGLPIASFPTTFTYSTWDSGTFDGTSDALTVPAQIHNGTQLINNPTQKTTYDFGDAQIWLQDGNVHLEHKLDFRLSSNQCDCGCGCGCLADAADSNSGNAGLVYNSDTVDVRPIIQATVITDGQGPVPTQIQAQLTWNGTSEPAVTFDTSGHSPGDSYALAVQVPTPVTTSGLYPWALEVTATLPGGDTLTQSFSGTGQVIANDNSPYGPGWGLEGVDHLAINANGALWVSSSGGGAFLPGPGNTFISPGNDFGSLVHNGDGSYTYTGKDEVQSHFDSQGHLLSTVDTHGLATSYTYDGAGRLTQVTEPDGGVTTFTYDGSGLLQQIAEPGSRTVTISHDGAGDLTTITDADGSQRTFTYDSGHRLTDDHWETHNTTYTYDTGTGALSSVDRGSGDTLSVQPEDVQALQTSPALLASQVTATVTDALGRVTSYTLDSEGRLEREEQPLGVSTSWQYDSAGQVIASVDALGHMTQYSYQYGTGLGDRVETLYPDGSVERYQYDPTFHHLTRLQDPLGRVTTYTYDAGNGDLLTTDDPLNQVTTYTWSNGLLLSVTDPNNNVTTYQYDPHRRMTTFTDALGNHITYTYDGAGNMATRHDALGHVTTFVYDEKRGRTQETDAAGGVTMMTYDAQDHLTSRTDALGHVTQDTYDSLGQLTETTEAVGTPQQRTTTYAYDAVGNVVSMTDPRGITTHDAYDALDRLTSVTEAVGTPEQRTTSIIYDAASNIIETIDPLGRRTQWVYDPRDRPTQMIEAVGTPEQRTTSTIYDPAGNVIETLDPLGRVTQSTYDGLDRRTSLTEAVGTPEQRTSSTTYDPDSNVLSTTDPLGNTTHSTYDGLNRQTSVTDPLGHTTTTVYDANSNVISVTDPRGNTTHDTYDALNRLVETVDALNQTSTTVYDAVGNVVSTTDRRGNTTTYGYDALNRQTSITDQLGHTTHYVYDPNDNLIQTTDPLNFTTTYTYDPLNRQVQRQDAVGALTSATYDTDNNVTSTTDPLGHTTTYGYDHLNRQTTVTDPLGHTTIYHYDAVNNRTSVTDPAGNTTTSVYDPLDREVQRIDPQGHTTTNSYDADNRLLSRTDRDGRSIQYAYDAGSRLTTQTWKDSGNSTVNTLSYTYDANNNLLTASDSHGSYTMSYDALDRLSSVQEPFGLTLTYSYDANGNSTGRQDSRGGTATYSYDAANRLTSSRFTDGSNQLRLDMSYDARNEVVGQTRYADLAGTQAVGSSAYAYDGNGRLTSIVHKDGGGSTLASYAYTYDLAGRLTSQTINSVTQTYSYDDSNQLTNDNGSTHSYDANGNRTDAGYATSSDNRLLSDGTWNYSYDNEGNLVAKVRISTGENWSYGYDNLNHLVSAVHRDGSNAVLVSVTYVYDVLGNRIEEDVAPPSGPAAVTRFAYDGDNVWADLDGSNNLQTRRFYLEGADQVFARLGSGGTAWYLTDYQGSVRDLVDGTGALQDHLSYDGFGNVLSESNAAFGDRYKYTGREFDFVTGLQYNRARYYDPTIGRFTSEDPIGIYFGDRNPYRYVGNDPTNGTDPSGLDEKDDAQAKAKKIKELADAAIAAQVRKWEDKVKELQTKVDEKRKEADQLKKDGKDGEALVALVQAGNLCGRIAQLKKDIAALKKLPTDNPATLIPALEALIKGNQKQLDDLVKQAKDKQKEAEDSHKAEKTDSIAKLVEAAELLGRAAQLRDDHNDQIALYEKLVDIVIDVTFPKQEKK